MTKKKNKSPSYNNNLYSSGGDTWLEAFGDGYFENLASNKHWQERFCVALIEFGKDPKNIQIIDFCKKHTVPRDKLYKLAKKYEIIGQCFDEMKLMLHSNRCRLVPMTFLMEHEEHRYDPEWHENEVRKAELKKKEPDENRNITIVLEKPDVEKKPGENNV